MRPLEERKQEIREEIARNKRRLKELEAEEKESSRKARTRALILIGGLIVKQFPTNPQLKGFLKNLAATMPGQDRECLASAYPDVFPAPNPAPAQPSSAQSQESAHA